jgi:sugar phosphate isomerase/epimerase
MMAGKASFANAASAPAPESVMKSKRIGLQIYSLGGELQANVPQGMKKLKDMGYQTLELAGFNNGKVYGIDMMEFKKMANDAGLVITSSHVNPPTREYTKDSLNQITEYWKKTADDHAKLGVNYLVQPGQPQTRNTDETKYVCEVFNKAGEICKAAGVPFGYHNHWFEFAKVNPGGKEAQFGPNRQGQVIYDMFVNGTDPDKVFFEMDVYWAIVGGIDPVEYMKKYADRIKVLHIKDKKVLGQSGMMNFSNIFAQHYANGHQDYFVELEKVTDMTQFEGVAACADYLKKSKFVK